MATTTWGLSTFQQPDAIDSWLSPWVAGALAVHALLGWRLVASLRANSPEARWWAFALASFAPVSQVFPFLYPVADRYLYFILPGLVGGAIAWLEPALRMFAGGTLRRPAAVAAGIALLACSAATAQRARIWGSPALVLADSAAHYPNGLIAHLLRARAAASRSEFDLAVQELQAARRRGFNGVSQLIADPVYARARDHAGFQRLLRELAREWVDRLEARSKPTQLGLKSLSRSYLLLGDREAALGAIDRALAVGGPLDAELRQQRSALVGGTTREAQRADASR
jgi:tetratricopeptide (TPR) repeat protein